MLQKSGFLLVIITLLVPFQNISAQLSTSTLPKYEFRGVWVATVANIDWPIKQGQSSEIQKNDFIRLLDDHQQSGINAIMFQIRPSTDALYGKGRELWSRFLTGKQGLAPAPYYDPLEFAIEECHKRGMELHAWINPYRATTDLIEANTNANHITRTHPGWFFSYGGKKLFNPGIPQVRDYIVQVILDIVRNYDVDGIHFDDYFYPYPEGKQILPDTATFRLFGDGYTNINDWRRHNVDTLIHVLADSIHKEKKYVKFGISPFGIWKNKKTDSDGSETNGLEGFTTLFADARLWAQKGWIDYVNPQVYFPFGYAAAPYEKLVDWWSNNSFGKHLYIGQAAYRVTENKPGWRDKKQLPNQIRYLRQNPCVQGSVFFSSKSLTTNLAGVRDSLKYDLYRYKALQPVMPWLDNVPPQAPLALTSRILKNGHVSINWAQPLVSRDGETAYGYVIYRFNEGENIDIQNPANILKISFDKKTTYLEDNSIRPGVRYTYAVTAIDRLKNESPVSNFVVAKLPVP